jgi:hypothetical protein
MSIKPLRIDLLSATKLRNTDKFAGKLDPYVEIVLGDQIAQTHIKKDAGCDDILFNESMIMMYEPNGSQDVYFTVKDKDTVSSDDVVGVGIVDVAMLQEHQEVCLNIQLKHKERDAGNLVANFTWVDSQGQATHQQGGEYQGQYPEIVQDYGNQQYMGQTAMEHPGMPPQTPYAYQAPQQQYAQYPVYNQQSTYRSTDQTMYTGGFNPAQPQPMYDQTARPAYVQQAPYVPQIPMQHTAHYQPQQGLSYPQTYHQPQPTMQGPPVVRSLDQGQMPSVIINGQQIQGQLLADDIVEDIVEIPQVQVIEEVVEIPQIQTIERVVEVPRIVTQEREVYVPKIVTQERVVEVPQIHKVNKYVEIPQIQQVERVVHVPQIITQERVVEVPKIVTQERIVEVPQIKRRVHTTRAVNKVEYQKVVREVPKIITQEVIKHVDVPQYHTVDKVVEVPQIQEIIREVPRVEIQEVIHEIPKLEMQEVVREVHVPQVQIVDRFVEVPQYQELTQYVPSSTIQYVDVYPDGQPCPTPAEFSKKGAPSYSHEYSQQYSPNPQQSR